MSSSTCDFCRSRSLIGTARNIRISILQHGRLRGGQWRPISISNQGPSNAPLFITIQGGRGQGDHRSDLRIYSQLSDKLRVLSFDYRGHGQSSQKRPYTFDQIVDDVEGMRKLFVQDPDEEVMICGGSFGGFLAEHYAIKYASHVYNLVLRGTAASRYHEEGAIETLRQRLHKAPSFSESMLRNKIFKAGLESDLEFRLIGLAMAPLYKDDFDPDEALKNCLDSTYVAESHNELYSEQEKYFDYTNRLHEITARTLIVVGENDWICPPDNSKSIAERIPNAELVVVEDANHGVHIDKPELVLGMIRSLVGL